VNKLKNPIAIKILGAFINIFIIITISFLLVRFMPGDPLIHLVGQEEYYYLLDSSPETLEELKEKYGLSDSIFIQYMKYLKSILYFDFGRAYSNHRPVLENVLNASKWTLFLSVPTWILGGIIGGALGLLAGFKPGSLFDKISTSVFLLINTIPSNCLSLILLIIFSYKLRLFPINGMVSANAVGADRIINILWHMMLPLFILILSRTSGNFMLMKSSASQVRKEEYVITAYSKGLSDKKTLFVHMLKNALLPYSTSMCMQLGYILSGSMIVEVVFGWKGMGMLLYNAVLARDFPTAQLCFLISAVMVVSGNLLGDIVNALIDPRIKEDVVYE
jgi:peptide/nickel transport system permease protein